MAFYIYEVVCLPAAIALAFETKLIVSETFKING